MGTTVRGRGVFALILAGLLAWAVALPASAAALPTPLAQVGSTGSGAGQLSLPADVAIDGSGNLYVTELGNDRVSVFSPTGAFIHAFGFGVDSGAAAFEVCTIASVCQAGTAGPDAGRLSNPGGVAVDGSGNLYVPESTTNRISVFNPAIPSFTRAFGRDVRLPDLGTTFEECTTATGCLGGDSTTGNTGFNGPRSVALDGAGNLFVSDDNHRINEIALFDPSFTRAFGWDVADPNADLAFEVCPAQGTCAAGDPGLGVGQLTTPEGITADCRGAVWVAGFGNNRVQRFGEPGTALPPCPTAGEPPATVTPPAATPSKKKCKRKKKKGGRGAATAKKKCKKRKR